VGAILQAARDTRFRDLLEVMTLGSLAAFGLAVLLDEGGDLEDGVDRGVGNDAVAEVEDVAGAAGVEGEDFADAGLDDFGRGEEGDGIEVALDGDVWA
jgi:hypothetical protein